MLDIYSPSELTLEEHIERIQKSFETLRQSLFTTIVFIKECREQLGDEVFQKDVSELLGMSPSYLNKWISIGNSDFIMNNQDRLPHTFSSLYSITQLEKKYVGHYGPIEGIQKLEGHVDRGDVSLKSQQSEISNLIQNIEERIKRKQKLFREQFVLGDLQNGTTDVEIKTTSISECLDSGTKFHSFVINLPNKLIRRWGDEGVSELDIINEFPLHDLRMTSINQGVNCLLIIPSNKIHVGIKVLTSFGFKYRDVFVPPSKSKSLVRLSNELVILRGGRGLTDKPQTEIKSTDIEDLIQWVEENSSSPNCCVFDQTNREDWVCLTQ
tara:strand:+ start:417 stop:1391 length:975 start_codon:yes stop_codon:yes gene_type:complete